MWFNCFDFEWNISITGSWGRRVLFTKINFKSRVVIYSSRNSRITTRVNQIEKPGCEMRCLKCVCYKIYNFTRSLESELKIQTTLVFSCLIHFPWILMKIRTEKKACIISCDAPSTHLMLLFWGETKKKREKKKKKKKQSTASTFYCFVYINVPRWGKQKREDSPILSWYCSFCSRGIIYFFCSKHSGEFIAGRIPLFFEMSRRGFVLWG